MQNWVNSKTHSHYYNKHAMLYCLQGERFKEATKINLSLSALGNVISSLVSLGVCALGASDCLALLWDRLMERALMCPIETPN